MELYGTAPSPFTRKVAIVLRELGLDYDFKLLTEIASDKQENFANNPLLQLPTLVDGEAKIFDSALICQYLLEKYGSERSALRYLPNPEKKTCDLLRLVVINGGMDAGVKLIRAKRSEIPEFQKFTMFRQEQTALTAALDWLDKDFEMHAKGQQTYYPGVFSMLEVSLQCFLDWAPFRQLVPNLDAWPRLKTFNQYHQGRPSFLKTHPVHGA